MSSRLTFGSVKTMLARVLSMNTTDIRVAEYCSRAQERLLHAGKWVGTYGRFHVCTNNGCLTWPREIETIEAAALCNRPMTVRNEWYEFIGPGPGIAAENRGFADQLLDRSDACAFDDVAGTGKKLAVYCDGNEAAGATILLRYYRADSSAKVYTTVAGEVIEGEYITLPAAGGYTYSTYECMAGGFYDAVKPATLRTVRIYEYTVAGGALKPLAYYEPDETNPVYRRSLIPCISNTCNGVTVDGCGTFTLDIVGKFRTRDVAKDSDALIIQSRDALRMAVQAIMKEEMNLIAEAQAFWGIKDPRTGAWVGGAFSILDMQLKHWLGSGYVAPIKVVGADTISGGVYNLV